MILFFPPISFSPTGGFGLGQGKECVEEGRQKGGTHTMKSAKSTLKVRNTLDSLLENISMNGTA